MSSKNELPLVLRRSRSSDAAALSQLTRLGTYKPCIPPLALFPWRTEADFAALIERSVACITATSTITGKVAGFICLDDIPHVTSIPRDRWEDALDYKTAMENEEATRLNIAPYNTLWMKSVIAPPSTAFLSGVPNPDDANAIKMERQLLIFAYKEEEILQELLSTALTNMPDTKYVLVPFPSECKYEPIECFGKTRISLKDSDFKGSVLCILSCNIIPQLQLRLGILEDYDDFVPDILNGYGLITSLKDEFYLDEILKDQDDYHKVLVAEDATTHQVVGIMCVEATIEHQQNASRQYMTEMFGKLRPLRSTRRGSTNKSGSDNMRSSTASTPNIIQIYFFQIDPVYSTVADQFLPFLFKEFPFAEYAMIILPYEKDEPPFLRRFENVPLRRYQPRNVKGDPIPSPEGMWITCRYAADPIRVLPAIENTDIERISEFLEEPFIEFSQQHIAALLEDINVISDESTLRDDRAHTLNAFILESHFSGTEGTWKGESLANSTTTITTATNTTTTRKFCPPVDYHSCSTAPSSSLVVGVASTRCITVEEMYALRANYDIDVFVNYYTDGPRDYSATDIHLTADEGRRKFHRKGMPGLLIRSFYLKSVYRRHIPFFVREILRQTQCEVALVLEDDHAQPFAPLLRQLLCTSPRRVQEKKHIAFEENTTQRYEVGEGKDTMPLGVLFVGTRRIVGDQKKLIHTRIVIVGAGSTGLSCIYNFISIPYVTFTNIILISTDGLPIHPNQQPHLWCTDHMELMEREYMRLLVGNPIRIIHGSILDIDTNQKYVTVDDGTYEPYDYVVLTTGRQYIVSQSICNLHQYMQQQPHSQPQRGFIPEGTLALSGESSVEKLRQHLQDLDRNPHNISNIVVYGSGLDAFVIVTSIISLGFSSQRIVIVSPDTSNPFLDNDAFDSIIKMYNSLGINILRGYEVARMEYDDEGTALTTVVVSPIVNNNHNNTDGGSGDGNNNNAKGTALNSVELSCSLIVCCEDKDIDGYILSTLNRRAIVFDGRVIVESNYRTTNKCIYSAGPVAMFTRRYGTTLGFDNFNSRDVGINLSEVLLHVLGFEEFHGKNSDDCRGKNTQDDEERNQRDEEMMEVQNQLYTRVLQENGSYGRNYSNNSNQMNLLSMEEEKNNIRLLEEKLPKYNSPITNRIHLPGGFTFFSCHCVHVDVNSSIRLFYTNIKDNKPIVSNILDSNPLFSAPKDEKEENNNSKNNDSIGQPVVDQSLLVIYIDKGTHFISAVVYFGNGEPEIYHYIALIGMPQSLFNLIYRYEEAKKIHNNSNNESESESNALNLIEYLRSPKLQVLFYDRFIIFYKELREKMRNHEELVEAKTPLLYLFAEGSEIGEKKRNEYLTKLTDQRSSFARQIQYELLKFLHESKDYLPQVYYLPDINAHVQKKRTPTP